MDFKKFVNGVYLDDKTLKEMNKSYLNSGVLKLERFLKDEIYSELSKLLKGLKGEHVKIADRYSYSEMGDLSGVGKLFSSSDFLNFTGKIAGKNFDKIDLQIFGFGHKDYTLLHDSEDDRKGTEFIFIFSEKWDKKWGGYIVYTDNEDKSLIFLPQGNNFALVNKEGLGRFVKYINHLAKEESFILVLGRFQ